MPLITTRRGLWSTCIRYTRTPLKTQSIITPYQIHTHSYPHKSLVNSHKKIWGFGFKKTVRSLKSLIAVFLNPKPQDFSNPKPHVFLNPKPHVPFCASHTLLLGLWGSVHPRNGAPPSPCGQPGWGTPIPGWAHSASCQPNWGWAECGAPRLIPTGYIILCSTLLS